MTKKRKEFNDPFRFTNLTTLLGSMSNASRMFSLGEHKTQEQEDKMSLIVNYPSYTRKTDEDF